MKCLFMLFCCVVPLAGCERQEDPATVRAAIEKLNKEYIDAFNRKNLNGVMMYYWDSPDLIAMFPDGEKRGFDSVRVLWQQLFDMVDVKKFEVTDRTIEVGHHMAYEWGHWNYTFQPKGGTEMTTRGRTLNVWAEKNNKWVVVAQHVSVPLPPMPAPQAEKPGKRG